MRIYVKAACDALTDPKLIAVGPEGFTMFFKGLMIAKKEMTDGFIPKESLPILGIGLSDPEAVAAKLVAARLWVVVEGGFSVPEGKWAEHQITREQVEKKREETRVRVAEFREKNKAKKSKKRTTIPKTSAQNRLSHTQKEPDLDSNSSNIPVTLLQAECNTPCNANVPVVNTTDYRLQTTENIKKESKKKEHRPVLMLYEFLPEPYRTEKLSAMWLSYLDYRKAKGKSPYIEQGLKKVAAMFPRSNISPEDAPSVLEHCMAQNWEGIPPDFVRDWNSKQRRNLKGPQTLQGMAHDALKEIYGN